MDNLRKEINRLIDNMEDVTKIDNKDLYVVKFVMIETILYLKDFRSFHRVRKQLNRVWRYNHKKYNIYSKCNNLRKLLQENNSRCSI